MAASLFFALNGAESAPSAIVRICEHAGKKSSPPSDEDLACERTVDGEAPFPNAENHASARNGQQPQRTAGHDAQTFEMALVTSFFLCVP